MIKYLLFVSFILAAPLQGNGEPFMAKPFVAHTMASKKHLGMTPKASSNHAMRGDRRKKVPKDVAVSPFADFDCKVVERPVNWAGLETGVDGEVNDYVVASYVYGSTSHPNRCQPKAIVFAETEDDIMKAIQYAYERECAISCRSGCHHFGGFGSSAGKDITIDLSRFDKATYDADTETYTIGVGTKLGDLSALMRANGQMVPHGECSWVRAGGHMQTGGYSPFFSRSFGFFCDHVQEFTIILPPNNDNPKPEKVVVKKPAKRIPGDRNSDLWWAVQGGSPGNFGVITEMKVKGIKDEDHADARSMSVTFAYDENGKEKLKTFLEILSEFNDDDDLPADYAFNVICLAGTCTETMFSNTNSHRLIDSIYFPFFFVRK